MGDDTKQKKNYFGLGGIRTHDRLSHRCDTDYRSSQSFFGLVTRGGETRDEP